MEPVTPTLYDVLCGAGYDITSHPGNNFFQQVVAKYGNKYRRASSKKEKMQLTHAILLELNDSGIRVLKKDSHNHYWHVADPKVVRDKIGHTIRRIVSSSSSSSCSSSSRSPAVAAAAAGVLPMIPALSAERSTTTTNALQAVNREGSNRSNIDHCREQDQLEPLAFSCSDGGERRDLYALQTHVSPEKFQIEALLQEEVCSSLDAIQEAVKHCCHPDGGERRRNSSDESKSSSQNKSSSTGDICDYDLFDESELAVRLDWQYWSRNPAC